MSLIRKEDTIKSIIHRADQNMYKSKQIGRGLITRRRRETTQRKKRKCMKQKLFFPWFLLITLMLACSCPLSALPVRGTTPTVLTLTAPAAPQITSIAPMPSPSEAPFNMAWDDRSAFENNLSPASRSILSGLFGASIYHIAFSLSDPPTQVNETTRKFGIQIRKTSDLNEVDFAVFPEILGGSITISKLSLDGQPISPNHQNGIMKVPLSQAVAPGRCGDLSYRVCGHSTDTRRRLLLWHLWL